MLFKGSGVAIITPFKDDFSVDYEEYERILDFHLANSTDAIIVAGTTGEAATLTDDEHLALVEFTVKKIGGRIPVIAGTGSNNTDKTIEKSRACQSLGVDGLLVVTPYYNKPSQAGLLAHFEKVADSVDTPIILYTVPGRTGVNIEPTTVEKLSRHKNIVGIKDATGDLGYTMDLKRLVGDDFAIYSGNDDLIVPILSVGGHGVISVLANAMPKETHDMIYSFLEGDSERAGRMQLEYKEFIDSLFCESNPIPIKFISQKMGFGTGKLRLPLVEITRENQERVTRAMKDMKLL